MSTKPPASGPEPREPPPEDDYWRPLWIALKVILWVCVGIVALGLLLFGTCLLMFRH